MMHLYPALSQATRCTDSSCEKVVFNIIEIKLTFVPVKTDLKKIHLIMKNCNALRSLVRLAHLRYRYGINLLL